MTRITMRAMGQFTLRGVVLGVNGGDPPPVVSVTAHARPPEDQGREETPPGLGVLAQDGEFEIHGLLPGRYAVSSHFSESGVLLMGGSTVEITDADATVEIKLVQQRR